MITLQSLTLTWLLADRVRIEVDVQAGIPSCTIVGLGDAAVQESRERIRSAIKNSEYTFPTKRITVNLAPAHIRKVGSQYDLGIALGILLCDIAQYHAKASEYVCIGELALNGEVRSVRGALALILAAIGTGYQKIMVSVPDYQAVTELDITLSEFLIAVESLAKAYEIITGKPPGENPKKGSTSESWQSPKVLDSPEKIYFAWSLVSEQQPAELGPTNSPPPTTPSLWESIIWHTGPKRALMIAAAGGHNIILEWPPGSGKSLLARSLTEILPSLSQKERIEIAQIYSLRWELSHFKLLQGRPFRQIHKSASTVSIVGGGTLCLPGEMSLAHRWVIFFDELLEFSRTALESLREPLEQGEIHISRAHATIIYPARCMFVGATNPCPCGYLWDSEHPCQDGIAEITKYRSRLSGPIADRIDMRISVGRIDRDNLTSNTESPNVSFTRELVNTARAIALARQGKGNNELSIQETEALPADPKSIEVLRTAIKRLGLSLRVYHRTLRVSQTIADLENAQKISPEHILEALSFRES